MGDEKENPKEGDRVVVDYGREKSVEGTVSGITPSGGINVSDDSGETRTFHEHQVHPVETGKK